MQLEVVMTTFDDREKAFEDKFAHDSDLKFKAKARCTKLLCAWAAERLGLSGAAADAYLQQLRKADLTPAGSKVVVGTLQSDFKAKGVAITDQDLVAKYDQFLAEAVRQVEAGI
jgi:hypothetical protein